LPHFAIRYELLFFSLFLLHDPQTLQRASSVPTRSKVPDKSHAVQPSRHEQTQSQDQDESMEDERGDMSEAPMTPSTTEESVAPTSMEPLLNLSIKKPIAANIKFEVNGQQALPNLPGIIPLQGHLHQQGWL